MAGLGGDGVSMGGGPWLRRRVHSWMECVFQVLAREDALTMTAHEWFQSYADAVDFAWLSAQLVSHTDAEQFTACAMLAYTAAKGMEYADEVARQASALLAGVEALRRETT